MASTEIKAATDFVRKLLEQVGIITSRVCVQEYIYENLLKPKDYDGKTKIQGDSRQ